MTTTYSTRDRAIQHEIVDPIEAGEASAAEYDIDAIADQVLGDHTQGYALAVDHEKFWEIVKNSRRAVAHYDADGHLSIIDTTGTTTYICTYDADGDDWVAPVDDLLEWCGWRRVGDWDDDHAQIIPV